MPTCDNSIRSCHSRKNVIPINDNEGICLDCLADEILGKYAVREAARVARELKGK